MGKQIGFLIDLDGTIYQGSTMIAGADLLVRELKAREVPFVFVTNNSSRSPKAVAMQLTEMGIPAEESDIVTSSQAAAQYIVRLNKGNRVYVIGEQGLMEAIEEAGLLVTEDQPNYVVQGIDRFFTYNKLAKAVQLINSGAAYILTNPDLLLPGNPSSIPGAGSISASIQAAAQVQPVVIGKPSAILMNYALDVIGLSADKVYVVGDNIKTDIGAGIAAGCSTILMLTGLTTSDNLNQLTEQSGFIPNYICDDWKHFMALLRQLL